MNTPVAALWGLVDQWLLLGHELERDADNDLATAQLYACADQLRRILAELPIPEGAS